MANKHWESGGYSVSKTVLTEGDFTQPNPRFGSLVFLNVLEAPLEAVEAKVSEWLSDLSASNLASFELGTAQTEVDRCLEVATASMYPGEEAILDLHAGSLDGFHSVNLTVRLDKIYLEPPLYDWSNGRLLEEADKHYNRGVRLVKAGRGREAFLAFRQSLSLASFLVDGQDVDLKVASEVRAKCIANISLVHFKADHHEAVVLSVGHHLINFEGDHVKLLYRRGVAQLALKNLPEAIADLQKVCELEPDNKVALRQLVKAKTESKKHSQQMASALKKMFN